MKLDAKKTAMLTLDYQFGIMGQIPGTEKAILPATKVTEFARKAGMILFHVGIGFEPGYPEIKPNHPRFSLIKERGIFLKGSETAQIHPSVFKAGETIIYKHRVSGFSGSSLQIILESQGVENLVLLGFATSGVVLSTLRQASDLDFNCVVIKDACQDRDEEIHRVLTEKIFTAQAKVLYANDFIAEQS